MKRLVIISVFFLFVFTTVVDAQRWRTRRWESYAGIGTANHYGDIGGAQISSENLYGLKDIQLKFTRPSIAVGGKYKINHRWFARVNLAGAYIQGNDAGTANELARYGEGYKFTSFIFEPTAIAEFYIIPEARSMVSGALYNRRGMVNGFRQINLYVFGGAGSVVNFPTVKTMVTEQEITTDDWQLPDAKFHRAGVVFPVGIGARMDISSYWTISAEFGRRYTLTDYVDGYTSKFSSGYDTYDFMNVIFSYKIRTGKNGLPVLFRRTGLN